MAWLIEQHPATGEGRGVLPPTLPRTLTLPPQMRHGVVMEDRSQWVCLLMPRHFCYRGTASFDVP